MLKLFNRISDTRLSLILAFMASAGILILFLPVMAFSIYQIAVQGEQQYMQLEVQRTKNIFKKEIDELDLALSDWSAWDETYQFAQGQNPAYIQRHLPNSTFSHLDFDIFLVFGATGEVILAKNVDHHTLVEAPLPFSPDELLQAYPSITQLSDPADGQKGLVLVNDRLMLLAARPILTNQQKGPAQGTLVFMRQFNEQDKFDLSQLILHQIEVYALDHLPVGLPDLSGLAAPEEQIIFDPINNQFGVGYQYLYDLNRKPVAVLSVTNPRILLMQGQQTGILFSGLFLALALLLFGGVFFFSRSMLASRKASRRYLERYQVVIQRSSEAILVVQPDWTILDANPTSIDLLAFAQEPDRPVNLKDLLTFEPALDDSFLQRASRESCAAEFSCIRHDGRTLDVELVVSQIFDGDTMAFSLNLHDITSRKKTEQALRESEERYRLLFENNPLPMWIYDQKTLAFLEVNDTAVKKYGYTRDEFLGMTIVDMRPAEDDPALLESVRGSRPALQQTGGWRHRLKDGTIIDVNIISHLLQQNERQNILVVAQDVTERKRIEREMRSAKDLFSKVFHLNPIASTIVRIRDLAFIDVNHFFEENLGYAREELIGRSMTEFGIFPDPAFIDHFILLLMKQGQVRDLEVNYQTKSGEMRQGIGYAEIFEQDGEQFYISNVIDVTEQKQAETALQISESRLRLFVEHAPAAIAMFDKEMKYLAVSRRFLVDYRLGEQEIIGRSHYDVFPDVPERWKEIHQRCLAGAVEKSDEDVIPHLDGSVDWFRWEIHPWREPSGDIGGLVLFTEVITERKQAEQALQASQVRFRALIEHAPDGIILLDEGGQYVYASPSTLRIRGYTNEELAGRNPNEFLHPEDVPFLATTISDLKQNPGKTTIALYRVRHKDGRWRWIETWASNLLAEPSVNALVFNYRDITERKQTLDALRNKTEELETLFSISTQLRQAQTVNEMLPLVLDAICATLGADASAVLLLDPKTQSFRAALANGLLANNTGWRISMEKGMSGEIFHTRQPVIYDDYAGRSTRQMDISGVDQIGPTMLVPLQSETQFLGVVVAVRLRQPGVEPFTDGSARLLTAISEMVGIALRRLTLFEDAQRRLNEVQALREIDLTIIGSMDLQLSLHTILDHIRSRLGVDAAGFLVLNPHRLVLEYTLGEGFKTDAITSTSLQMGQGYAGQAAMERRTIHIPDLGSQGTGFLQSPAVQAEGFVEYYAVPLLAKGQVKGVLEVFHRGPLDVNAEWVEFLETLAGQSAIAIENAGLYMDLQQSNQELVLAYDATIEGWSRALDLRDKETEGHTQRVTDMTVRLARAMGIPEAELVHVRRGALLHDIGKMGIPDQILLKPGPLTGEEWEIMRKHPFYAYQMLAPIAYLRPALDIPYGHHEKWDGTGYPRGLKGDEIPLAARIFAVVDVWDAVTSNRPYRQAWSAEKALEYICSQTGRHFDPHVVEKFENIIQGWKIMRMAE